MEISYDRLYKEGINLLRKSYGSYSQSIEQAREACAKDYFRGYSGYHGKPSGKIVKEKAEILSRISQEVAHLSLIYNTFCGKRFFYNLNIENSLAEAGIEKRSQEMPFILGHQLLLAAKSRMIFPIYKTLKRQKRQLEQRITVEFLDPVEYFTKILKEAEYYRGFVNFLDKKLSQYGERIFGEDAEKATKM